MFGLFSRATEQFLAACETKNLTAAAERCGVTQPAVTKSIRKLEQALGVPLFERGPRGLTPTVFGDLLRRHLAGVEDQTRYLEADLAALVEGRRGHIRMGVGQAVATMLLPGLIAAVQERFPGIEIEFETAVADEILPRLLDGTLDLMFASTQGLEPSRDFAVEPLMRIDMAVFAAEGHPLFATACTAADLSSYRWNLFSHDVEGQRALRIFFERAGLPSPGIALRASALDVLIEIARRSDGLVFLASTLEALARTRGLAALPLAEPIWSLPAGIAVRRGATIAAPIRFIVDHCRDFCRERRAG